MVLVASCPGVPSGAARFDLCERLHGRRGRAGRAEHALGHRGRSNERGEGEGGKKMVFHDIDWVRQLLLSHVSATDEAHQKQTCHEENAASTQILAFSSPSLNGLPVLCYS